MLRQRVIPCLLLKNNSLTKTIKFNKGTYIGDPINALKIFNEKEADEIVILDISEDKETINFELIQEFASECFMPLGYGGKIKSMDQINKLFKIGVEKVILGTSAFDNPELIKEAVSKFGSQSIVGVIDYKKNWLSSKKTVFVQNGKKNTKFTIVEYAQYLENLGIGEIILQNIDLDGTRLGYDLKDIESVSNSVSIPVIALGGANNLNDFSKAIKAGASGVAAGSFFTLQPPHNAVLITYPNETEITSI
jgi:cyclase